MFLGCENALLAKDSLLLMPFYPGSMWHLMSFSSAIKTKVID